MVGTGDPHVTKRDHKVEELRECARGAWASTDPGMECQTHELALGAQNFEILTPEFGDESGRKGLLDEEGIVVLPARRRQLDDRKACRIGAHWYREVAESQIHVPLEAEFLE